MSDYVWIFFTSIFEVLDLHARTGGGGNRVDFVIIVTMVSMLIYTNRLSSFGLLFWAVGYLVAFSCLVFSVLYFDQVFKGTYNVLAYLGVPYRIFHIFLPPIFFSVFLYILLGDFLRLGQFRTYIERYIVPVLSVFLFFQMTFLLYATPIASLAAKLDSLSMVVAAISGPILFGIACLVSLPAIAGILAGRIFGQVFHLWMVLLVLSPWIFFRWDRYVNHVVAEMSRLWGGLIYFACRALSCPA